MVGRRSKQKKSHKILWKYCHRGLYSVWITATNLNMVKGPITTAILIALMTALSNCGGSKSDTNTPQAGAPAAVNDLPALVVTLLDGSKVNLREVKSKTILIIFHPDCDHCQREARQIQENLMAFGSNTLYFISSDPIEEIANFAFSFALADKPNVLFGQASMEQILNSFGPIDTPSMYIYSGEQTLIKTFNGETELAVVFKYV